MLFVRVIQIVYSSIGNGLKEKRINESNPGPRANVGLVLDFEDHMYNIQCLLNVIHGASI